MLPPYPFVKVLSEKRGRKGRRVPRRPLVDVGYVGYLAFFVQGARICFRRVPKKTGVASPEFYETAIICFASARDEQLARETRTHTLLHKGVHKKWLHTSLTHAATQKKYR